MKPLTIVGKTFGDLTVLFRVTKNSKEGRARFKCRCVCGTLHTAIGSCLINGHTTSCGHIKRKNQFAKKPPKQVSYNTLYGRCKRGAKVRNLEFSLTKDQHKEIISNNCYYCDNPPRPYNPYTNPALQRRKSPPLKDTIERAWVLINGIDRADNKLGYTIDNCVPCCTECNESKSDAPVEEFINRAYRIVEVDKKRKYNEA